MKCNFSVLLFVVLVCLAQLSELYAQDTIAVDRYYNDVARYYAGLPQEAGSTLSYLDSNEVVQAHQQWFDTLYQHLDTARFPAIRQWVSEELDSIVLQVSTLFYPFSGPDFCYADLFFPQTDTMILIGLERVGMVSTPKELNKARQKTFFEAIHITLNSIYEWGYFITMYMSRDFNRAIELKGVTPVIMLFMARADYRVLDVEKVVVDRQGQVKALGNDRDYDNPKDYQVSGVHLQYRKDNEQKVRHLYYWSHDVSNSHLAKTPWFKTYIDNLDFDATFFKAASYLPSWFIAIREAALGKSRFILQTDSGIPFRYFDEKDWSLQLYGKYVGILKVFSPSVYQKDLKSRYQTDKTIKSLDFGIGYGYRKDGTNLLLAIRK